MMPPMPNFHAKDEFKVPKPKSIKEVPSYLKKLFIPFFSRMTYIIRLVWEASPGILFVMMFMALFNGLMPIAGSLIEKELLNRLSEAYSGMLSDFSVITYLLLFQFAYLLVNSVIVRLNSTVMSISGEMLTNHIKIKIMNKAKDVDMARFDDPNFYAKMENANREAGRRPIEVLEATFTIVSSVISMIGYIIIISAIGIVPALLVIAVAIPSTIINFIYRKKNHDYMFFRSKDRRQMNYYSDVVVNKDLVKEIKMLGLTDVFTDKYKKVFKRYFKGLKKLILDECFWNIGASLLTTAVNCVLFIMIAKGVFQGDYQIGDYSLYTGALNSISSGIATLITTTASIYEGTLFIGNLMQFMQEKKTIVPSLSVPRDPVKGITHKFTFENVSFRYPGTSRDVIKNVDLTINAGEAVVIVGLNGAGKTTLLKLLTRLYDPTEGKILLDGHDLKEYDVDKLYKMFGIIFQDYGKYACSVSENISFGEVMKDMKKEVIEKAAKESGADQFINDLPEKYDTPLMRYFEEDGIELSIGQWQKLAISRAFYSDSDVLILDEPTASIDAIAEQEIFNQFDQLRKGKTTLFVSHRLSSATTADKIIVMKDGKIEETGNHSTLMKNHGEYYTLFSTQAKRYITADDPPKHPDQAPPKPFRC